MPNTHVWTAMTPKKPDSPAVSATPAPVPPEGSAPGARRRSLRGRLLGVLLRPKAPPLAVGIMVAAAFIAVESVVVHSLQRAFPDNAYGALFLLGVLVVSAGWGVRLAVATSLVSTMAYLYFHLGHTGSMVPTSVQDFIASAIFLPVALLANILAGQARLRAAEANRRRLMIEESHAQVSALAEQQAALRHVATAVAQAAAPAEVFSTVVTELARVLAVDNAALLRYGQDATFHLVAAHREDDTTAAAEERFARQRQEVADEVVHTGRAARIDGPGDAADSAVGAPIVVNNRVWGVAMVGSSRSVLLPPDTEARVGAFADLVATAIANAQAQAELTASRARIVTAADDARRRLERDMHDGVQQRLVSVGLELRMVEALVPTEQPEVKERISHIGTDLTDVFENLRELCRGIHPAILSKGGLAPALKSLARHSPVPVELDLQIDRRLPESVEVAAYYVVAEALTNAAKHARASSAYVKAELDDEYLRLLISDDGVGGADSGKGSGLIGLVDRVEAVGGRIDVFSPAGEGTRVRVSIRHDGGVKH